MSEAYRPELGQAIFGQPHQEFAVPDIMDAALCYIRDYLDIVMWNVNQKQYASPFGNTGNSYQNDTFQVEAYSWDEEYEQPFNFKWGDVEISWYKYLGRGMSANMEITPEIAADCLAECLEAVRGEDTQ